MSTPEGGRQPTEAELRAAYEEEIRQIRVEQILLEQVVTLINLGMRRTGMAPGTEGERDLEQVRLVIESVRVLLPLVEQVAPPQIAPIRDALSQLQLAFVRLGGEAGGAAAAPSPGGPAAAGPDQVPGPAGPGTRAGGASPQPDSSPAQEGGGPAQRSGRLWVPGQ